jgi:hypothetical protein
VRARRRKSYRLEPARLIGRRGALVVNILNGDGTLEHSFDFSPYASRPVMDLVDRVRAMTAQPKPRTDCGDIWRGRLEYPRRCNPRGGNCSAP